MFSIPFRTAVSRGLDTSAREWPLEDSEKRLGSVQHHLLNRSLQGSGYIGTQICHGSVGDVPQERAVSLFELRSPEGLETQTRLYVPETLEERWKSIYGTYALVT